METTTSQAEMPTPPQAPAPTGFITSAKEAVSAWKSINRAREATANQMVLGLSLTGHIDQEKFNPGIIQGYLEAMEHPSVEKNGKVFFLFQ